MVIFAIVSVIIIFFFSRRRGNTKHPGYAHMSAGWEFEKKRQFKEALEEYKLAEEQFRENQHAENVAKAILVQALVYKRLKDYDNSKTYFEEAIECCLPLKDPEGIA